MHCLKCLYLCPYTFLTFVAPSQLPLHFPHTPTLLLVRLSRVNPLTSSQPQVTPPLTLSLLLSMISHAYQAWALPPCHLPIILVASSTDIDCSGPRMKETDGVPVSEIRTLVGGGGRLSSPPINTFKVEQKVKGRNEALSRGRWW